MSAEMFPNCSKTDLLLPKAKPLRGAGGTSVITYLRKGKNCCAAAVGERRVRKM